MHGLFGMAGSHGVTGEVKDKGFVAWPEVMEWPKWLETWAFWHCLNSWSDWW